MKTVDDMITIKSNGRYNFKRISVILFVLCVIIYTSFTLNSEMELSLYKVKYTNSEVGLEANGVHINQWHPSINYNNKIGMMFSWSTLVNYHCPASVMTYLKDKSGSIEHKRVSSYDQYSVQYHYFSPFEARHQLPENKSLNYTSPFLHHVAVHDLEYDTQ
eukprot:Pgem_evm1s9431